MSGPEWTEVDAVDLVFIGYRLFAICYWLCPLGLDSEAGSDGFGFAVNSAAPLGLKKLA